MASKKALPQAIHFTLDAEGGFTHDNGGDTMHGVTQHIYDLFREKKKGLPLQSVRLITDDEVLEIMEDMFWTPAHCKELPDQLAIAHFDWAYNHGPEGATRTLQSALGFTAQAVDGVFGPRTLQAVNVSKVPEIVSNYLNVRRAWYRTAAQKNPAKYQSDLNGWLNRVNALEKYLKSLPVELLSA